MFTSYKNNVGNRKLMVECTLDRASAFESIDFWFDSQVGSHQKLQKIGIHSSLDHDAMDDQQHMICVDKKSASLLVVSLGKVLNRFPQL